MVDDNTKMLLWQEATKVENKDPNIWRHDPCGALIKFEDYGNRTSKYGWEEDHVVSRAFLLKAGAKENEIEIINNLRAMHWENNDSKGVNYPDYKAVVKDEGGVNKRIEGFYTVNEKRQNILHGLFSKYGI